MLCVGCSLDGSMCHDTFPADDRLGGRDVRLAGVKGSTMTYLRKTPVFYQTADFG